MEQQITVNDHFHLRDLEILRRKLLRNPKKLEAKEVTLLVHDREWGIRYYQVTQLAVCGDFVLLAREGRRPAFWHRDNLVVLN